MNTEQRSAFWESIPSDLRDAVEQSVPAWRLEKILYNNPLPPTLAEKYALLESVLKYQAGAEAQGERLRKYRETIGLASSEQRLGAHFALAMLYTELQDYGAAEDTLRRILRQNGPSRPDLAAMSNLIEMLNLQHKYVDAEALALEALPLIQRELGEKSPQASGCMRKLMQSLLGQDKCKEARRLHEQGTNIVATIEDGDTKQDEADAMREMGGRIGDLT